MINNFVGVGRLTKDVDLRYSPQGTAVANFTIAITRRFDKEKADFIKCVAFKKTAELTAEYVKKGNQIGIEGSIQTGSYQNNEGKTVYTTDVIVNNVQFLESKNSGNKPKQNAPSNDNPFGNDAEPVDIPDDLPF